MFTKSVIWNFKIQTFMKRRKGLWNHLNHICQDFYVWIFIQSNVRGKVILMFLIHLCLNHQIVVFLKAIWCSTSFWILLRLFNVFFPPPYRLSALCGFYQSSMCLVFNPYLSKSNQFMNRLTLTSGSLHGCFSLHATFFHG